MRTLALALALAAGCGYTSSYVAPTDGRPRAVWREDHVVVEPAGAPLGPACAAELGAMSGATRLHLVGGELRLDRFAPRGVPVAPIVVAAVLWTPRYWGPPIVAPAPGVAPLLPMPPLLLPPPVLALPGGRPTFAGAPVPSGVASTGSGPDLGDSRALEVLAAVALVVLPAVALGLALSRPEDSDRNAEAVDQVNAWNDLLRTAGTPCAEPAS